MLYTWSHILCCVGRPELVCILTPLIVTQITTCCLGGTATHRESARDSFNIWAPTLEKWKPWGLLIWMCCFNTPIQKKSHDLSLTDPRNRDGEWDEAEEAERSLPDHREQETEQGGWCRGYSLFVGSTLSVYFKRYSGKSKSGTLTVGILVWSP